MSDNSFNNTTSKAKMSSSMDSSGSSPSNTSRHDMQDINRLLFLETLRRMKEDENNINRQLAEKQQQFDQVKAEYASLYEKYAKLMKLAAMRNLLESPDVIAEEKLDECKANVENLLTKIKPDHFKGTVSEEELIACKEKLQELAAYENVDKQYETCSEHKQCMEDIRKKGNNLSEILLSSTIEELDKFVEKFELKKQSF